MPAWLLPLAISGISALSGYLANRKKTAEQEQKQNSQTIQESEMMSMPEYDPQQKMMRDTLMQQYLDQLSSNEDYFGGYRNQGLQTINQGSDAANRAIENVLASRGLSGTSAGITSSIQNQLNRVNQQSSFLNEIPLLQDKRYQDLLGGASGFFSRLPVGTRQSGRQVSNTTGTSSGTVTDPGNPWGGAIGGLSNSLFGLYGAGAFSPKTNTGTTGTTSTNYDIVPPGYKLPGQN